MSFGFRVGVPGMRVRVSTRGVRTSLGPRAARLNIGSGRTTVSTGFGPFFASSSLSGGRRGTTTRRAPHRNYGPSAAQLARAERDAVRQQQNEQRDAAIAQLNELRRSSTSVHLETFSSATHPVVPLPPELQLAQAEAQASAHHLRGIGLFARTERRLAKQAAHTDASIYLAAEQNRLRLVHQQLQHVADQWWAALTGNDEATVCEAINSAFADNPAAGSALGCTGSRVSIVMRQQDIDSLPTQTPSLTSAGRPSLKTLTKRDRVAWWLTIMGSNVIATCKEAFAVAPGITDIDLAVITRLPDTQRLGIVTYGSWSRRSILGTSWSTTNDALRFLDIGTDVACSVRTTAGGNLSTSVKPLDVNRVAGLQALLDGAIDDGVNPLAELDTAMSATAEAPLVQPNPYVLVSFSQWLSQREDANQPDSVEALRFPATPPQALSSGQTVLLPEDAFHQLDIEFTFTGADADVTLMLLEDTGRVGSDEDFVFYNQPSAIGGAVRLLGKHDDAANVSEKAVIHLSALPSRITTVVVSVNMDVASRSTCAALSNAKLTFTAAQHNWIYSPPADPQIRAMTAAQLYRHTSTDGTSVWKLRALGQGWADGLDGLARAYGVTIDN